MQGAVSVVVWSGCKHCECVYFNANNHPYFTQLQFHIEVVKMMISDFLARQHAIQEGTVQTGH